MGQRPIAIRVRANAESLRAGSVETDACSVRFAANDTPLGAADGTVEKYSSAESETVCSISEAARRLGVSERTIFRLLKTGVLERVEPGEELNSFKNGSDISSNNDAVMSDINKFFFSKSKLKFYDVSVKMSDKNKILTDNNVNGHFLCEQIRQKDIHILHLLRSQQEMAQTIQRLQEQMFELAHLVLTHNAAAAQAKVESELKAQEQSSRRGLANLLSSRNRK